MESSLTETVSEKINSIAKFETDFPKNFKIHRLFIIPSGTDCSCLDKCKSFAEVPKHGETETMQFNLKYSPLHSTEASIEKLQLADESLIKFSPCTLKNFLAMPWYCHDHVWRSRNPFMSIELRSSCPNIHARITRDVESRPADQQRTWIDYAFLRGANFDW